MAFKNSAPINSRRTKDIQNYLRFILPFNATISGIQINNQEQKIIPAITDPTIYEAKGFVSRLDLKCRKIQRKVKPFMDFW